MSEDEFLFGQDIISISNMIKSRIKYLGLDKNKADDKGNKTNDFGEIRGVDFL